MSLFATRSRSSRFLVRVLGIGTMGLALGGCATKQKKQPDGRTESPDTTKQASGDAPGQKVAPLKFHTAVALASGRVLIAGGSSEGKCLARAELYDTATEHSKQTASMRTARSFHTATMLRDDTVLVVGGEDEAKDPVTTTELYLPKAEAWSELPKMNTPRSEHTATLLSNGKVLVVGGRAKGTTLANAELFEPSSKRWVTPQSQPKIARLGHTATLLNDGRVLIAGGRNPLATAHVEIYDPVANTWTQAAPLAQTRAAHTATRLPNGNVLVAGGWNSGTSLSSAELYDPVTNVWTSAGPMHAPRFSHTATALSDGSVLIAGGYGVVELADVEVYKPAPNPNAVGTWEQRPPLSTGRMAHSAVPLGDDRVLFIGGLRQTSPGEPEIYRATTGQIGLRTGTGTGTGGVH